VAEPSIADAKRDKMRLADGRHSGELEVGGRLAAQQGLPGEVTYDAAGGAIASSCSQSAAR
jgi:hypothetical protein